MDEPNLGQSPVETGHIEPGAVSSDAKLSDSDARMWAMICHFAALAKYTGIPLANVLGPLVVWQIKKDQSAFVDDQGKEAVNFQISVTIYAVLAGLTFCIGIGIVLLPAVLIFDLVFLVIAGIKANQGELYRYPLSIRFIS